MPPGSTDPNEGGRAHEQAEDHAGEGREPLLADARHHDEKGQEQGREDDVDGEGLGVGDDWSPVGLGVQGGASIVPEQIKPASGHFEAEGAFRYWRVMTSGTLKNILNYLNTGVNF